MSCELLCHSKYSSFSGKASQFKINFWSIRHFNFSWVLYCFSGYKYETESLYMLQGKIIENAWKN